MTTPAPAPRNLSTEPDRPQPSRRLRSLQWLACLIPLALQFVSSAATAQMQLPAEKRWTDCWSQVPGFYDSPQAVCDVRSALLAQLGLGVPLQYVPFTATLGDCIRISNGADYGNAGYAAYCMTGWLARNFGNNWMCAPVPPGTTAYAHSAPAGAYCERSNGGADREKSAGNCPSHTCNPINISTGNKFQRELDYQGTGPQPLRFERYYNSFWPDSLNDIYPVTVNQFRLGRNWQHNYDLFVRLMDNGTLTAAKVRRPDGKQLYFALTAGVWKPEADISDRLERVA